MKKLLLIALMAGGLTLNTTTNVQSMKNELSINKASTKNECLDFNQPFNKWYNNDEASQLFYNGCQESNVLLDEKIEKNLSNEDMNNIRNPKNLENLISNGQKYDEFIERLWYDFFSFNLNSYDINCVEEVVISLIKQYRENKHKHNDVNPHCLNLLKNILFYFKSNADNFAYSTF